MACESGYPEGCYNLGVFYINGIGVRQDYSTAKEYFGKACDFRLQLGCDGYKDLNKRGF